jgi:hypothetical protein
VRGTRFKFQVAQEAKPGTSKLLEDKKMNEDAGEELGAIIDELLDILHQPVLPLNHPDAAAQRLEKREAQVLLNNIGMRLRPVTRLALAGLYELIDLPNCVELAEVKRRARITLLKWNAHYGPGGPYEAINPARDDGKN